MGPAKREPLLAESGDDVNRRWPLFILLAATAASTSTRAEFRSWQVVALWLLAAWQGWRITKEGP